VLKCTIEKINFLSDDEGNYDWLFIKRKILPTKKFHAKKEFYRQNLIVQAHFVLAANISFFSPLLTSTKKEHFLDDVNKKLSLKIANAENVVEFRACRKKCEI
jgi:hypothetical protein